MKISVSVPASTKNKSIGIGRVPEKVVSVHPSFFNKKKHYLSVPQGIFFVFVTYQTTYGLG